MKWRIYRLPGSRENWHIDAGPGTAVINVTQWRGYGFWKSVDTKCGQSPRAWIEILRADLHIVNGLANFDPWDVTPRDICETVKENKCVPPVSA